jgi:kumamolisin
VYVRPRHARPAGLSLEALGGPPLTPEQVNDLYGADPADLERVAEFARAHGIEVVESSSAKRSIKLAGTVETMKQAFGVQLQVQESAIGRYRGRQGPVHVPEDLAGVVEAVFGLDNRRMGRSYLRRAGHPPVAHAAGPRPFLPTQAAQLYSFPTPFDGSNQCVGILAFNGAIGSTGQSATGGYSEPALKAYFEQTLQVSVPALTDVVVHGPGNQPGDPHDPSDVSGEVMLDIQVAGGVAPRARIVMYFTEFTEQGWVDAIVTAVTDADNKPSVLSISYGNPEDAQGVSLWTTAAIRQVNDAFHRAALSGITICCASGDDGSNDQVSDGFAHTDFPASSPYVLACGGTRVETQGGAISLERVWNDGPGSAGGGGVSRLFPRPDYQRGLPLPPSANPGHRFGRGVPDVSGLADPETGMVVANVDGTLEAVGGTSATAPLWAGLILRINQALGGRCGFLNPVLYHFFPQGVLRDIVLGDNGVYQAGPGWDACTGLGSPNGAALLAALASLGGAQPAQLAPGPSSMRAVTSAGAVAQLQARLSALAAEQQRAGETMARLAVEQRMLMARLAQFATPAGYR